jgi:hypothetical protein
VARSQRAAPGRAGSRRREFEKGKLVERDDEQPDNHDQNQEVTLTPRDTPIHRA